MAEFKKIKYLRGLLLISFAALSTVLMIFSSSFNNKSAYASSSSINVSSASYELSDSGYHFEDASTVSSMSYGRASLGTFSISGEIIDTSTYRNQVAYGVGGAISFSYTYSGDMQGRSAESWNIVSESATSVNDYNLSGSIASGAVLVQKSGNGSSYSNVVNPVTDFFATKQGRTNFYTTDGADIAQGVFYRVIIAYKTGRKTGSHYDWKKVKMVDDYDYKNNVEVYVFYICKNDGIISIHNLSTDESQLNDIGYSIELAKRGETLVNNSTTTKGFKIDKLGTSYLVSVAKDGTDGQYVDDGAQFTDAGKYDITVITKLGKRVTTTVYVVSGRDDRFFSEYFDGYLVQGHRVYRDTLYPVYARNSFMKVKPFSSSIPLLYGNVTNLSTNKTFSFEGANRNGKSVALSVGKYQGVFYSGDPTIAGSVYQYSFNFEIIDEDSAPYINYYNLMHRDALEELATKHYEVAYQTTRGGYVFACFALDSYSEALSYAYEIEGRFIERTEQDGLYYKSEENPNKKVKYYDPIELTRVRNFYAKQNVEINYFNSLDEYTYRTFNNDLLQELESINTDKSIKVFPSTEQKQKMTQRQPFLNNFVFLQVADFDSVSISAYCYKNGRTYELEYNKKVSEQLGISSRYKIIEQNIYGDKKEYDAYFIGENFTQSSWIVTKDGVSETINISSNNITSNSFEIIGDTVAIDSITNEFDSTSIVTIKAPNVYSFEIKCLISELKDIELYKKGRYEIAFIDRVGNTYKIVVEITGLTRFAAIAPANMCYTDFYNTIYINEKELSEEIIVDITELKALLDIEVSKEKFTSSTYNEYKKCWDAAKAVYENGNATQGQINTAGEKLQTAIDELVPTADKTYLRQELDYYENGDSELYTTQTWAVFAQAYNRAITIYRNDLATQKAVDEVVALLKSKRALLIERGNKLELYAVLFKAKRIRCDKYTPDSLQIVEDAFNEVWEVYSDVDVLQGPVDQAVIKMNNALQQLVVRAGFSELDTLIKQVRQVKTNLFTEESITALKEVYLNAVVISCDRNSTQKAVDDIFQQLSSAYSKLEAIGDKTDLLALLHTINEVSDWYIYTEMTISPVKELYDQGVKVAQKKEPTISEVEDIYRRLNVAYLSLQKRELKEDLAEIIEECTALSSTDLPDDFINTYNAAYICLVDLSVSDEELQQKIEELKNAVNNLNIDDNDDSGVISWIKDKVNGLMTIQEWHEEKSLNAVKPDPNRNQKEKDFLVFFTRLICCAFDNKRGIVR